MATTKGMSHTVQGWPAAVGGGLWLRGDLAPGNAGKMVTITSREFRIPMTSNGWPNVVMPAPTPFQTKRNQAKIFLVWLPMLF